MLGALGNLAGLAGLMKQAGQMGSKFEALQRELREQKVVGTAGGGLVEIEMNGLQEVLACRIDPRFPAQAERERLQRLITDAMNDALSRSKQLHAEALRSLTGGIEIPGLTAALGKMAGG